MLEKTLSTEKTERAKAVKGRREAEANARTLGEKLKNTEALVDTLKGDKESAERRVHEVADHKAVLQQEYEEALLFFL